MATIFSQENRLCKLSMMMTFVEVKYSKLCFMATKLCQMITDNTFIRVNGQQRSNKLNYVYGYHNWSEISLIKLRMMMTFVEVTNRHKGRPTLARVGPEPISNMLPWYSIQNSQFS